MNTEENSRYGLVTSISVRNNKKILGPVLRFLQGFCSGVGLTVKKQENALQILGEMLSLRIEQAYKGVGMITLDISIMPTHVAFCISDAGTPYLLSETAGGTHQILQRAEKCYMSVAPDKGQSVTFEFTYDDRDFDIEMLRRTAYPTEELLDSDVTIRDIANTDEEIIQAIECIYSAYGYGYCHEKLYNPDIFRQLVESGELHSYVASNRSGQILAHAALSDGAFMRGIPDLGTLVTKPFCRGLHIAERLTKHMLERAGALGYSGVRGEPVTFHPYTQKLFTANGMIPTGFLFHAVNPETCGVYRNGDERRDLAMAQTCFGDERIHRVMLPPEHRDFLRGLFDRLGLRTEEISEDAPAAQGSFRRSIDNTMRTGTLIVRGDGHLETIADIIASETEAEVLCLYLDMGHPGMLRAYRALLAQGFFLTGLAVGGLDGDYLVLQHLMGRKLRVSNMVLEPEYRQVFDYLSGFMDKSMLR